MVAADSLFTVERSIAPCVEEVVLHPAAGMGNGLPAADALAVFGKVEIAIERKQAADLALGNAVIAQIVEIFTTLAGNMALQFSDTGKGLIVLIVEPLTVLLRPALLDGLVQNIRIGKGAEIVLVEMRTALPRAVILVLIALVGVNAVCLLGLRVARNAVDRVGAQIDVITEFAADGDRQAVIFPGSPICGDQLQAAEDAQGVGRGRVNGLGLFFEIADQGQGICCLIHLAGGQVKILVDQLHVRSVDGDPSGDLKLDLHLRVLADAFGQLQQEIPRRGAFIVAAGQECHEGLELLGDGDLLHVDAEGIRGVH